MKRMSTLLKSMFYRDLLLNKKNISDYKIAFSLYFALKHFTMLFVINYISQFFRSAIFSQNRLHKVVLQFACFPHNFSLPTLLTLRVSNFHAPPHPFLLRKFGRRP